jgi:HlyD family secretion protein
MTIADLNEMEARVDLGENDVVLIQTGQTAQLEVDAFKDRKFNGTVTEVANSSNDSSSLTAASTSSNNQEATKFQVRIRIQEKEQFKPGMSVTAEISTRYRTNVLTVPIASVTTRMPKDKDKDKKKEAKLAVDDPPSTNSTAINGNGQNSTNICPTNVVAEAKSDKKKTAPKPLEVVFLLDAERVKMVPVKIGISDDNYWEVTDGLKEGQEVISGGYRAISRDLEDGKKVKKGPPPGEKDKEGQAEKKD